MWPVVIVLLVLAMMIGPIMLMQPTKEQRDLAELRTYARSKGLQVSASKITSQSGDLCWFYWRPLAEKNQLPAMLLERKPYAHGLHVAQYWSFTGQKVEVSQEIEHFLQRLPSAISAFEINAHAVGVHWSEGGGQKSLDQWQPELTQLSTISII